MTVFTGHDIRKNWVVFPHVSKTKAHGRSRGESYAGYDVITSESVKLYSGCTALALTEEYITVPTNWLGKVYNKSTNAREGIDVFNGVLEPGWEGFLTVEMSYKPRNPLLFLYHLFVPKRLPARFPIAQLIFEEMRHDTNGYKGKYQKQVTKGAKFD